ncbi:hypothetical protein [Bdellovibrio sp. HCB209]|uniref:hypothetical protein n=1 Tax=Bdellovibrio sp. HCB209 TaxID=3394354 RepID=UPI0039B3E3A2
MLRAGRFRHRLLDEQFLENNSAQASVSLAPFLSQWRNGLLTDVEMACVYLLIFNFLRRPSDFMGGKHNLPLPQSTSNGTSVSCREVVETLRPTLPESLRHAKSLRLFDNDDGFVTLFSAHSWRSIPFSVQRSLACWEAGLYPLQLMTRLPSELEVLEMQARGERVVSMLIEADQIKNFVEEGRDVLGFIVHDLIHADHFFHDPRKAQAQIHFCQHLLKVLELPQIQTMLTTDAVFRKEFHYLMSDMNSVPLHLLKTLKAVLLGFYKRQASPDMKQPLPLIAELKFNECYRQVLENWNFSDLEFSAALRLNTENYVHPADSVLLDQALSKNHSPTENYLVIS